MKVIPVQNSLTESQKTDLGIDPKNTFEWQITLGKTYEVISLRNILNSSFYGNSVLFEIEDDYGRLLPVPSCLFTIGDSTISKYWRATNEGAIFSLEPKEFVDDPSLTERILDRDPEALNIFEEIKSKLKSA